MKLLSSPMQAPSAILKASGITQDEPPVFTLFPKLPIDNIWKASFEVSGRVEIEIAIEIPAETYSEFKPPRVSQESRQEAQKHYRTLFRDLKYAAPAYFHPSTDTIHLQFLGPHLNMSCIPYRVLRERASADMDAIKLLEVRDFIWCPDLGTAIRNLDPSDIIPGEGLDVAWRYFKQLHELTVVADAYAYFGGEGPEMIANCQDCMALYFRKVHQADPEYAIPKVTAIPHQPNGVRTDGKIGLHIDQATGRLIEDQ